MIKIGQTLHCRIIIKMIANVPETKLTWADHLIPGLIFFREIIIRSEMATEWDTW